MTEEPVRARLRRAEMWRHRIAKIVAVAAPLIIAAVVILLTQQIRTANDLRQAERAAERQHTVLLNLLSAHQDIETGSRGYVITGNPSFLEPYNRGRRELGDIWQQLAGSYAENTRDTALLEQLRGLSARRLELSAASVELRRAGDGPGAAAQVSSGQGKAAMDEIRRLIGMLLTRQQAEVDRTSARSEAAITNLTVVTFALLGSLGALLVIAWAALHNSLRSRERALADAADLALRQKAILDSAMDGILTLNPSGTIESANAATLRMFGYAEGEIVRRDVGMLLASKPPIGMVAERLREMNIQAGSGGSAEEILACRSDGSEFPAEVALTATRLNEGLRYVGVIRDVTERKRVDQLKSDFVSTVSHELRTPLTSIAGALGLLGGGGAGQLGERAERLIAIAHNNADRLVRLINDILDIEKIESGKMPFNNRELDLKAAVSGSIEENRGFAAKYDVKVSFSAPMTPMLVHADHDRLAQVITNLLSNACKFSPPGGTIDVSIVRNGRFHRVTIADHGSGIPDEFRDRIFSKFAQADSSSSREKGGTGLGLSIVAEIVKRLDGLVSFDSEPGRGARFHVDLPALQQQKPARRPSSKRPSLLVCGNGAGTAFSAALRKAGYSVTFVRGAQAAPDALASRKFHGIVVDMGLPEGAGIQIIRMIRDGERNADTPVFAMGGEPGKGELEGATTLVLDWLRKPVDTERLVGSVDAAGVRLRTKRPRILHVEDDRDVQRLVAEALEGHAEVCTADGVLAARKMLAKGNFDLAIVDLSLADGSGAELLPELRCNGKSPLPVVIFSAQDADPEIAGLVDAHLTKARTPIGDLVSTVASLTATRNEKGNR